MDSKKQPLFRGLSPYMVQHGAAGTKGFVYGGYSKETGKWRGDAVEWLFSQRLPLFACVTDREDARFRLYSTSAMWLVRHQFGRAFQVVLCPDEHHDPLKGSQGEQIGKADEGDGFVYRVPLGNPIVDLNVFQLAKENRALATEALTIAINLEQENLMFDSLGVHVASWFTTIIPNDPASLKSGGSVFWNGTPGKNVPRQIASLRNIAITLALNLNAQGEAEKLAWLAPVFRFYPKNTFDSWILEKLPKVVVDNIS